MGVQVLESIVVDELCEFNGRKKLADTKNLDGTEIVVTPLVSTKSVDAIVRRRFFRFKTERWCLVHTARVNVYTVWTRLYCLLTVPTRWSPCNFFGLGIRTCVQSLRGSTFVIITLEKNSLDFFYNFTARRKARIASAVLAMAFPSVYPSLRPSVTRRYCVKTTARSTAQFALSDSKMCLVL